MIKKIAFIIISILCVTNSWSQSMEWLCRPGKYQNIQYMGNDLFKVQRSDNKWGIIHADGHEIIDIKYDSITSFVESRALILDITGKKLIGIIDSKGRIVKSFVNSEYYVTKYPCFKEGRLCYIDKNNRRNGYSLQGYLKDNGEVAIQPNFYLAAPFQQGIATVQYTEGYFGLINESGKTAITSDVKYKFLSSLVNGCLIGIGETSRHGGDILKLMRLDGNRLHDGEKYENGKYNVDLSDDFSHLSSQNGHYYKIDSQWRIVDANYDGFKLPYIIKDDLVVITESSEMLSKLESQNGVQIYYMGAPILEHAFQDVSTYEKKYAIVSGKNKKIGVLKLNPSSGIELTAPSYVVTFYHNTRPNRILGGEDIIPTQYVEIKADVKDVNTEDVKCYLNEQGNLYYAPLKKEETGWKLFLPYFSPDGDYDNIISKDVLISFTYDGMDWMHRTLTIKSKHEKGYDINISGPEIISNEDGILQINIESVQGVSAVETTVSITGLKDISFSGSKKMIPVHVNVPSGTTKTFTYTVTISEEGCPTFSKTVSKTISSKEALKSEPSSERRLN